MKHLLIMGVILGPLVLSSCTTTKYVDRVHTEYITRTDSLTMRDSIHVHDSISTFIKGDTVFQDKYHNIYRDRWRDRVVIDTVVRTDSIDRPVYIEKQMSWFDLLFYYSGMCVILLLTIYVIAKAVKK